jgi:hypothetical protein
MLTWRRREIFWLTIYHILVVVGVVLGVTSTVLTLPFISSSAIFAGGGGGGILLVLSQKENTKNETFELRFKMHPVMIGLFLGAIGFLSYHDLTDSLLPPLLLCLFLQVACFAMDPAGLIARIDRWNLSRR